MCAVCKLSMPAEYINGHEDLCMLGKDATTVDRAVCFTQCLREERGCVLNFDAAKEFFDNHPTTESIGVMYHWTAEQNHVLIEHGSFRIPRRGEETNGSAFGSGVYGSPCFDYGRYLSRGSVRPLCCLVHQGSGFRKERKRGANDDEWIVPHASWVLPCLVVHEDDAEWSRRTILSAAKACLQDPTG